MDRIRVFIHRSNTGLEVQAVSKEDKTILGQKYLFDSKKKPVEQAEKFGESFGKKLLDSKVKMIRFDRNKNRYHGRVKAFADGMRKSGIKF